MSRPLAERLRPQTIEEYIGQTHLVGENGVFRKFLETGNVPSFILWGPPGVGKTTLAKIVASALDRPFYTLSAVTSGVKDVREVIEKAKNQPLFSARSAFLFIDEIHRLNRVVEEILYPAMEDFAIDIIVGKGPSANSIRLDLPKFTLVGATTRAGQLSAPLRDRFGVSLRLELYTPEELAKIVTRSATILGMEIHPDGAMEIASRSRGTPRIANRMLRRVRDFAQVKYDGVINEHVAHIALDLMDVDKLGLDHLDRNILETIIYKFGGGPVGLDTLSAAIGEDAGTIEDVYEPYLIQNGLLNRTPKGRVATDLAFCHLGIEK